jgi:hypothetical protein
MSETYTMNPMSYLETGSCNAYVHMWPPIPEASREKVLRDLMRAAQAERPDAQLGSVTHTHALSSIAIDSLHINCDGTFNTAHGRQIAQDAARYMRGALEASGLTVAP